MNRSGVRTEPFNWLIVSAAAAVGLLQVLGALQVRDEPYRGYRTHGDGVISQVAAGGPAERAGLKAGDRLIRVDGIDARDRRADEARVRVRIGQTQTIVVDRGGQVVEGRLVVTGLPRADAAAYLVSVVTGLSFLACGLCAYVMAPRLATRLLAIAGVGVGGVFTEMPYFASPAARSIQETGLIVAGVLGFGALFHLILVLSGVRARRGRKAAVRAIYTSAAIVCAGKIVATGLAGGRRTDLADLTTTVSLVLILLYFCSTIVVFLIGYVGATRAQRTGRGLTGLAVGLLLGLAPMVPTAIGLVAPAVVLPGSDYYDMVWVLIPFALTRAVVLQARSEQEAVDPRSVES